MNNFKSSGRACHFSVRELCLLLRFSVKGPTLSCAGSDLLEGPPVTIVVLAGVQADRKRRLISLFLSPLPTSSSFEEADFTFFVSTSYMVSWPAISLAA
jgi:hypothetical protein